MESILVWTLIIAAVAIVSMLVLLIASERDVRQKGAEVASLRGKLEQANLAVEARANPVLDQTTGVSVQVAALTEQVQSNEVAIASLQCELEALRAENTWLKRQSSAYGATSADAQLAVAEIMPISRAEPSSPQVTSHHVDLDPRQSRVTFSLIAFALLLVGLVSIYFARDGQNTIVTSTSSQGATYRSEDGANENLAKNSLITRGSVESDDLKPYESGAQELMPTVRAPAAGASYEVVRSTRVFSHPNENSSPLARVEAGMEINVIATRDEWLEVRSRHGRPRGFIRKDAAIRRVR
jgi:hypothetical protein